MTPSVSQCPFGHGPAAAPSTPPAAAESTPALDGNPHPAEAPEASWVDPASLRVDPYPSFDRLRTQSPIAWVPGLGMYLVSNFSACHAIEQDQETFSANVVGSTMNRALGGQPMLRKDDPEHAHERHPINPVLRPKRVKDVWQPLFERNARTYLDALEDRGPQSADLNRDYAAPVAAQNLIDMLGFKDTDVNRLTGWSHSFIAGIGNVLDDPKIWEHCDQAIMETGEALNELVPFYQANPDDSLISALANSGLPRATIEANVKLIISGGMNEPQHMVTGMVYALGIHAEQRAQVLQDPSRWAAAFDETVRWRSPIGMYPRQTTRDTVLEGIHLPAGSRIGVVAASANHDPAQFGAAAADFDINRAKRPHLAFGSGVHLCAGHWAAKTAIGQIAVPLLYQRFPDLRLAKDHAASWDGWVFRGLTSLPVTWN